MYSQISSLKYLRIDKEKGLENISDLMQIKFEGVIFEIL
jgi:hypothetical protein